MKKISCLKSIVFLLSIVVLTSITAQQAKQYALFEHYTNVSCGPCATQNPIFRANILEQNDGTVHHIAYHPWWPSSTDPMYVYNKPENTARTQYYNVSAVPDMLLRGNQWRGGPAGVTQGLINEDTKNGSPIRIRVKETINGSKRDVVIDVETVGNVTTASYVLHTAIIEKEITYSTPPGSNGEKYFPNVFRKFLAGINGEVFIPALPGTSFQFKYSYTLDPVWDSTKIYVIAFVQNITTKEVVNSGSTIDPDFELMNASANIFQQGSNGNANTFSANVQAFPQGTGNYKIKLIKKQPASWSSSFDFDNKNYSDSTVIQLNNGFNGDIQIKVNVGQDAGLGEYTITVEDLNNPYFKPQSFKYYVISGITDLIVNNEESFGDGNSYDWEQKYIDGLTFAGNTTFASTGHSVFLSGMESNSLTGVKNIYYNIGWTFPSFTNEKANALETFLDNGGNLFVAGQDIGWDTWDKDGNGTPITKLFYTNYLRAKYLNDGNASNTKLFAVQNDAIYGNVSQSNLKDAYGGNLYPDVIEPINGGLSIFNYNNDKNKIAGVRYQDTNFKTVYLGIGIENIADVSVGNSILKLSHDWFNGIITGTQFDKKIADLIYVYPNPASDMVNITFPEINEPTTLKAFDMNGRLIFAIALNKGIRQYQLNTEELKQGLYFIAVYSKNKILYQKTISIIH
jgi:Outer membrane protein Omp28/Secretion system C-terminal sorting domain